MILTFFREIIFKHLKKVSLFHFVIKTFRITSHSKSGFALCSKCVESVVLHINFQYCLFEFHIIFVIFKSGKYSPISSMWPLWCFIQFQRYFSSIPIFNQHHLESFDVMNSSCCNERFVNRRVNVSRKVIVFSEVKW